MVGREPGALDARLAADQPLPQLPARVPVDDARALIQRRPDVRKAERELAASSAQIGQALSAYFPQVTLLGSIGAGATSYPIWDGIRRLPSSLRSCAGRCSTSA